MRDFGPRDAPVVVLLHGWTATADTNWFRCYEALGADHRVIAFDHRGHGSGVRSRSRFRLEDCADDVVAVADALGVDRFVPVGYSMGGTIAQLVWHRHRERVEGLVLGATAARFSSSRAEKWGFVGLTGLAALARVTPSTAREWLIDQVYLNRKVGQWEPWAVQEAGTNDWRMLLEAGRAIGDFSSVEWASEIDVPVAQIVTMRDHVVSRRRQIRLFELLDDVEAFRIDGDHDAVIVQPDQFVPTLLRAVVSVRRRTGTVAP